MLWATTVFLADVFGDQRCCFLFAICDLMCNCCSLPPVPSQQKGGACVAHSNKIPVSNLLTVCKIKGKCHRVAMATHWFLHLKPNWSPALRFSSSTCTASCYDLEPPFTWNNLKVYFRFCRQIRRTPTSQKIKWKNCCLPFDLLFSENSNISSAI